jgi:uncharacterized protein (DUF983 family)
MSEYQHPRPKTISFLLCTCPRCGEERVFKYSPFNLRRFAETKDKCNTCGLDYIPETGFFFGSMYWSYAILVALIVTESVVLSIFDLFDYALYVIPLSIIVLLPFIFRYSRMLMLYVVYPIMFKGKFKGE